MVGWNSFAIAPGPVLADGSDIAAVTRYPGHMEAFFIAPDGSVRDYYYYGTWNDYVLAPTGSAAPGGITAVSRAPSLMEVWWIGPAGSVEGAFFVEGKKFVHYQYAPPGSAAIGTKIRAVSRFTGHMEIWWISPAGSVEAAYFFDDAGVWKRYQLAPNGSAAIHGGLTAVSREPKAVEVWWVGPDGSVQGAFLYDKPVWTRYRLADPGSAAVGGGLRAQSRQPSVLSVFWISPSGSVEGAINDNVGVGSWKRFQIAGNGQASLSSGISSLHRLPQHEEVWWVHPSGEVMDAFWYGPGVVTQKWNVYGTGQKAKLNANITSVSQDPGTIESWFASPDGGVGDRYWYDLKTKKFSQNIVSGGLAALGGWVTVTLKDDGSIRWQGQGYDSGSDDYEYGVVGYVRPRVGGQTTVPIVVVHHGHVQGHVFGSSGRSDPWDVPISENNAILQTHFDDYNSGTFELNTQYDSGFLNTFESIFNSALKWSLGSLIDGVGLAIFLGVEVGSLITTGSLNAGARIINNILYLAGPGNTLLALAAGSIAAAGSRSRMITQAEYDFANDAVFRSQGSSLTTLPPRDRIYLTDTRGLNGRAFTVPMSDGRITINVGGMGNMYDDALNPAYKATLIHELTHAWQIAHTPIQLTLLVEALASQLRGSTSYNYPPPGPAYSAFNLEAQAQIVQEWWSGDNRNGPAGLSWTRGSTSAPYYRYIVQNIQTGQV